MQDGITLGDYELFLVSDGTYQLDGGAYFGVVPKVLWSRKKAADQENRIRVGLNCLVARNDRHTVLVETGIGEKLDEKRVHLYGVQRQRSLPEDIAARGIDPDSIDLVINTHLHFDHCGGNSRWQGSRAVPVFPRARYSVQRGELEHAHLRHDRDRVSYLEENYDPLVASGQMTLLDGSATLAPDLVVRVTPGHTRNLQVVLIQSGGQTCAYFSDLVPSTAHLNPTWIMAFDLFPLETIQHKKRLLAQAAAENWLCVFVHDAEHPWGYVRLDEAGRFEFEPVPEPAPAKTR